MPIEDGNSLRIITIYCFVTCLYIPATIIILVYFNNLYNIGRFSCYPLLLGLTLVEYAKYGIRCIKRSVPVHVRLDNRKSTKCKSVIKSAFITFAVTLIYYFVAVLFGAPLFEEQEQTLMFSCLLSVLTIIPACFNLGVEATLNMFSDLTASRGDFMFEVILQNIQFTLVGAWFGAFVIPLDWDREWQKWPIPCCLGALIGYLFSHIFTLGRVVFKSSRHFSKKTGKYSL